jgi:hypothetical protein
MKKMLITYILYKQTILGQTDKEEKHMCVCACACACACVCVCVCKTVYKMLTSSRVGKIRLRTPDLRKQ